MLDMNVQLGREVATATEVLQVIRPQLRAMRYIYRGMFDAARDGWLSADEDFNLDDTADNACFDDIHAMLMESAIGSVKSWARDMGKVFDGPAMHDFVRLALSNAMTLKGGIEQLPADALDY